MSQISRNIQSPSVAKVRSTNPFSGYVYNFLFQRFGIFIIQLRQRIISPPFFITVIIRPIGFRLFGKFKILSIWTLVALKGTERIRISLSRLIEKRGIHIAMKGSAVIKNTVNNNPHSSGVTSHHKVPKKGITGFQVCFLGTANAVFTCLSVLRLSRKKHFSSIFNKPPQVRIDMVIILCVIFVIGGRYEKRVKVQNLNAKVTKIVQLLPNSFQVSTVKTMHIKRLYFGIPVLHCTDRPSQIDIFPILNIVLSIRIVEAIHKNLIHNRSLYPGRNKKIRKNGKSILLSQILRNAKTVVM